jgi:hypothetical protein
MLALLALMHLIVAAGTSSGFWGHVIAIGEVAGAIGAITAVGVFMWSRLRLDKLWAWIQKNIKADQKAARLAEFYEAQTDPKVVAIRKAELSGVINEQIVPELTSLKAAHQTLHDCLDRNTETVKRVEGKVEKVITEQDRVATELTEAKKKVDIVAKGMGEDRVIMRDHIDDDKLFQDKSEAIWRNLPNLIKKIQDEKTV